MKLSAIIFISLIFSAQISAATLAIIDSGVDLKHQDLINNAWVNQNEIADNIRDDDKNGYEDDVSGWNFAENNNKVIDYKFLGTFSDDPYKFFEIQGKNFWGVASPEEIKWVNDKRTDVDFLKEMAIFGNFVHGTHVAAIAAKDTESKVLAVKIIPTTVGKQESEVEKLDGTNSNGVSKARILVLRKLFTGLAKQQMNLLEEVAVYINGHNAKVANGSFGTGFGQAMSIVERLMSKGTAKQKYDMTLHFMNAMIKEGSRIAAAAKDTLFVFAAGNDGVNNDDFPTSPANIKADNTISVAATMERVALASFSCFGAKQVDVAAPGVTIESAVPGDRYLQVSGTSQAAPYVANIAVKIREINPELSVKDVRRLITETVDKKDFLKGKVKTGGIVNSLRATTAATYTLTLGVSESLKKAKEEIIDIPSELGKSFIQQVPVFVFPLPSMFR